MCTSMLVLFAGGILSHAGTICDYDAPIRWSDHPTGVFVKPCSASDATQRWAGDTLTAAATTTSTLTNAGARPGACLGTRERDPVSIEEPCAGALFLYNSTSRTVATATATGGLLCLDLNHGTGPDIDFWPCHDAASPDFAHQQFDFDAGSGQLRPLAPGLNGSLCLALNRTAIPPYVAAPCTWPSAPPAADDGCPFPPSAALPGGLTVLENATSVAGFGADTWYPAEDRHGVLFSGFDDGAVAGVSVGSACTRPRPACASGLTGFHTGSSVVSGSSWRNLSAAAPGGAVFEDGFPQQGRYTCANVVANGTWWVGSYGLAVGDAACSAGTGVLQFCEMGPFVGFRSSRDGGRTWREPRDPASGAALNVSHTLFGERAGAPVKLGAPHVVDFGPENARSPDGRLYVVGNGCLAKQANSNCSWISGDAVFLARAGGYSAAAPDSLNDPTAWEFFCGRQLPASGGDRRAGAEEEEEEEEEKEEGGEQEEVEECWTPDVARATPVLTWVGRVGTVTATWHPGLRRFLFAVTTPTTLPSTVGPYDTYVLEAPALTGPFKLVSYMPKFGQQAYFVSFPSLFLGAGDGNSSDAVLSFSANFACKTGGCKPNIKGAGYGANLLPVRLGGALQKSAGAPLR